MTTAPVNYSIVKHCLESRGFSIVSNVIDLETNRALCDEMDRLQANEDATGRRQNRTGVTFGIRNLLRESSTVKALSNSPAIRTLIDPVLGTDAIAVRGIFFDKTTDANWKVPWHQDRSIAVSARLDVPGFGPWSIKAGVPHVQPPTAILERMLTLRLHLDDCDESNGPLLVLPGSHRHGQLQPEQIAKLRESLTVETCIVPATGAVLMRPLLLHASSAAILPRRRRVVHIEFGPANAIAPLEWHVA